MQIDELARMAGISSHSVREYSTKGFFSALHGRSEKQDYDPLALKVIELARGLEMLGFSLCQIEQLLASMAMDELTSKYQNHLLEGHLELVREGLQSLGKIRSELWQSFMCLRH